MADERFVVDRRTIPDSMRGRWPDVSVRSGRPSVPNFRGMTYASVCRDPTYLSGSVLTIVGEIVWWTSDDSAELVNRVRTLAVETFSRASYSSTSAVTNSEGLSRCTEDPRLYMNENLARCAVLTIAALLVTMDLEVILEPMLWAVGIGFVLTLAWAALEWFWDGYRSEVSA